MVFQAGENGAPVEITFENVRNQHFQKAFVVEQASGSATYDDQQGFHWINCKAIAVDRAWDISGGPEGFGELFTWQGCHAYYRELGILGTNAGNAKVSFSDFLGHGNLSTIQAVALTGTSIAPVVDISHNTMRNGTASGATRIGINITSMGGVSAHNRAQGLTNPYGLINGSVSQTGNTTY